MSKENAISFWHDLQEEKSFFDKLPQLIIYSCSLTGSCCANSSNFPTTYYRFSEMKLWVYHLTSPNSTTVLDKNVKYDIATSEKYDKVAYYSTFAWSRVTETNVLISQSIYFSQQNCPNSGLCKKYWHIKQDWSETQKSF